MKIGDTISFSLHACAYAVPSKITRKVKEVKPDGSAIVRFAGYSDFEVNQSEIINIKEPI